MHVGPDYITHRSWMSSTASCRRACDIPPPVSRVSDIFEDAPMISNAMFRLTTHLSASEGSSAAVMCITPKTADEQPFELCDTASVSDNEQTLFTSSACRRKKASRPHEGPLSPSVDDQQAKPRKRQGAGASTKHLP
ncbi:hypothetical protein J1614_003932 [Plenodomus biglobosus]|nr:hypothetical protein J1614_003932 [Plenodomus biglobosus]